jgi:hypothetical protein
MFGEPAGEVKKLRCRMAAGRDAAAHAGSLYRKLYALVRRPVVEIEHEAEHLHAIEEAGESAATPLIAFLGIFLFVLPIFLFFLGVAFAAYYIAY